MRLLLFAFTAVVAVGQENPLLKIASLPAGTPLPFSQIRPEHVAPAIDQLMAEERKAVTALKAASGPRTWANTMDPLETVGDSLSKAFSAIRTLESVRSTPEMRKEFNAALPKVSAFLGSLGLDPELAALVKAYAETPEAKALTGPKARLLQIALDDYRRSGAFLDAAKRKRLQEINVELAQLSAKFQQNVLDATNAVEWIVTDESQLRGLPESAKQAAAASAKAKGKEGWRFTLQAPSRLAVVRFADDASFREKVWRAGATLASGPPFDNRPVIAKELALRREKAQLLGYSHFADLQTEDRMAKSGDGVKKFLTDLEQKARPGFEKDRDELQAFRRSLEGATAPALQAWDVEYYAEKMRQKLFAFDEEQVRPYYPIDRVFAGLFGLAKSLYGVQVKEIAGADVWDKDVKFYEMRDADGTLLGHFYSDWFPRDNKRSGAWMSPVSVGGREKGEWRPHLGMIVGNVTPPVSGKPALLAHREVETIFHEFGHLLHLLFGKSELRGLGGIRVAWDFVELPSQIMENFTWERPVMDLFAAHYETGEKLPADLLVKMKQAKTFRAATGIIRSAGLGMMDIRFHSDYTGDDSQGDPLKFGRQVIAQYSPTPLPDDFALATSFSHIFAGGYAAGYYSYQWAEVLDADAFSRFRRDGVLNSQTAEQFRRTVLERGNSAPPDQLFRDFMGRDPDVKALLERSGLDLKQNMK